jgi:hypothetical protein
MSKPHISLSSGLVELPNGDQRLTLRNPKENVDTLDLYTAKRGDLKIFDLMMCNIV